MTIDLEGLKARLADVPGIETLTISQIGGRLIASLDGLVSAVDPSATEDQIAAAVRNAVAMRASGKLVQIGDPAAAPVSPPTNQPQGQPMSVTGAAHATLTIKEMMAANKQNIQRAHQKFADNTIKLAQAANALDGLADDVGTEADDLLAAVGQFKNDLG